MNWLDGMTGCGGECNIDGSSVTFSNFKLLDEGNKHPIVYTELGNNE